MGQRMSFPPPPPPPPPSTRKTDIKIIVIAILFIAVLVLSLVAVIVVFSPSSSLQKQITDKNNQISLLQQQVTNLQSQVNNLQNNQSTAAADDSPQIALLQSQITQLNDTITTDSDEITQYNSTLAEYENAMGLGVSDSLVSSQVVNINADSETSVYNSSLSYAGYITVQATANSTTTYVETSYTYQDIVFDQNATLGTSGSASFPVLPTIVSVEIGNTDQTASNATVTITYYY